MQLLISWVGSADLTGVATPEAPGPLLRIAQHHQYDAIHLLFSHSQPTVAPLIKALGAITSATIIPHPVKLTSPIHFGDIYQVMDGLLTELAQQNPKPGFTIQLSSGTSAMSAVSILVGKTKFDAQFVQASKEAGVQIEDMPFDIAADFLPSLAKQQDQNLAALFAGAAPDIAAFSDILSQSPIMETLKTKAAILAKADVPVLIYGETGTGKELFAKAIHNASARAGKPLLVLNCGAIPKDLVDSTLFGYTKGAFSGAIKDTPGYFADANGGTLFLDEFGELPLDSQVRLLRVLQDGTYTPVGSTQSKTTNIRIIAATNKNLMDEVAAGRFREDLFYRVAIGVLQLPPLRERAADIQLIATKLLNKGNLLAAAGCESQDKKLSVKARKFMQSYAWPGNVRELQATLLRATLWHTGATITDSDIQDAILTSRANKPGLLDLDVSQGIDINEIISDVCTHYIKRALEVSNGSKSKAAELLGLKNYQTLGNWMEKYGIE